MSYATEQLKQAIVNVLTEHVDVTQKLECRIQALEKFVATAMPYIAAMQLIDQTTKTE